MRPPTPDPNWPADVQALYQHDLQEMWDRRVAPHIWTMYHDELRRYLASVGSTRKRVLDVGCAQGTLALCLAERGHDVCAMDIRPQFLEYAKSRYESGDIEFVAANAMEYDWERQFDVIFANQILEHLVYPDALLERLVSWLAPGGKIVCTTPNGRYIKSSLPSYAELGDPADYEHMQFTADGDGHFFAYLAGELEQVFSGAGLSDMRVSVFDTPWVTGHMKFRFVQPLAPTALLRGLDRLTLAMPAAGTRLGYQLWAEGVKQD